MTIHPGFVLEALVATLLLVSISYSVMLDRRLRGLRLGEEAFRAMISDLGNATERAERAVRTLREAIGRSEADLEEQIALAERRSAEMARHIQSANDILGRISRIVGVGDSKVAA